MTSIKEEKQEQLTLANDLSRIIASYPDLQNLLESIVQELKKFVSIDWAAIARIEDSNITLSPILSKLETGDWENNIILENTPLALLVEKKHALLESDLRRSKFRNSEFYLNLNEQDIRSVVYMPLFSGRVIFGSFIVGSKKADTYKDRELKLLKYTTTQITTVLERFESQKASKQDREALDWFKAIFHYTKTPLTPIMSSSGLLAEEISNHSNQELLPLAQNTERAARKLWQNLELFERIAEMELSQTHLSLKIVSPKDILTAAASYAHSASEENARSFTMDLPATLPVVRTDPKKLEQVLRILLDTAIRRTGKCDNIILHAYTDKNKFVIAITDSGPILSCEDKLTLLKPYEPSHADQMAFPEISLSLAICRQIIELGSGKLWIEPEDSKGTTFAFSIPIVTKIAEARMAQNT